MKNKYPFLTLMTILTIFFISWTSIQGYAWVGLGLGILFLYILNNFLNKLK